MMISSFANPGKFLRLSGKMIPWLAALGGVSFALGLWHALVVSPPDYQQGETVRIMYLHVPAAWCGLALYTAMAFAAGTGIVARHALADTFCIAAAPIGALFTALCLVTGSIWGRPTWGAWWVWGDMRLNSMLILLLLYVGYIVLRGAFEDEAKGAKAGFILLLTGLPDIVVVRFSVEWWNSLHQGASVMKLSAPSMPPSMLAPLLIMAVAFSFCAAWAVFARMRTSIFKRKIENLQNIENDV